MTDASVAECTGCGNDSFRVMANDSLQFRLACDECGKLGLDEWGDTDE